MSRPRPGHVPATSRPRPGHVPVTSRPRKLVSEGYQATCLRPGHVPVTFRPRPGQVIITSRPEGVRLRLYTSFVVMNLKKLTEEQQSNAIQTQLNDSVFYKHLRAFSNVRKEHDKKYYGEACPLSRALSYT